ncbi:MAG: DUF3298 domain-containing protein [Lachnospiraceae bacterium]|nr:DUF3298 domain-containing protein [Lachnospiraceae bacterium]
MDQEKMQNLKDSYKQIQMTKEQVEQMKKSISNAKKTTAGKNMRRARWIAAAAAIAAILILPPNISKEAAYAMSSIPIVGRLVDAVTFRNYQYEDDRHSADVTVPELIAEDATDVEILKKTTDEINQEIKEITDKIVEEFETNMKDQEGYQDIIVNYETIAVKEDYFTLKLICYQGAGSGTEWDYFYTIDLKTGERILLKDLFKENEDYITAISENIKKQMKEQMEQDENIYYWLDDEIEEWNFKQITDETSFYLNENGNIVICFNEGDVAPMYMGCVEFEISDKTVDQMRKK